MRPQFEWILRMNLICYLVPRNFNTRYGQIYNMNFE